MATTTPMRAYHGTAEYFKNMVEDLCPIDPSENDKPMSDDELMKQDMARMATVFGRLFKWKESSEVPDVDALMTLARRMEETDDPGEEGDVPAGMAFFGQFIDHDITFDATTELGVAAGNLEKIRNFRTPLLDLDSVYGFNPEVSPHLYGQEGSQSFRLLMGREGNPHDLPRSSAGRAIIGDPRNDENIIISQLHGNEFIALHNKAMTEICGSGEATMEDFKQARRMVLADYHNRILDDFLPAVIDQSILAPLRSGFDEGKLPEDVIEWSKAPAMPAEFSAAAFRFGHSMVPNSFRIQKDGDIHGLFDLGGFRRIEKEHNVNLDLFFPWGEGTTPQKARKIDTRIAKALLNMPERIGGDRPNLAFRNMERGQITFKLHSGTYIADKKFGGAIEPHDLLKGTGLEHNVPLWFYVLAEAETCGGKLGPVGGTIVAGTILNLLLRTRAEYDIH